MLSLGVAFLLLPPLCFPPSRIAFGQQRPLLPHFAARLSLPLSGGVHRWNRRQVGAILKLTGGEGGDGAICGRGGRGANGDWLRGASGGGGSAEPEREELDGLSRSACLAVTRSEGEEPLLLLPPPRAGR